jgi:hypothetical protein
VEKALLAELGEQEVKSILQGVRERTQLDPLRRDDDTTNAHARSDTNHANLTGADKREHTPPQAPSVANALPPSSSSTGRSEQADQCHPPESNMQQHHRREETFEEIADRVFRTPTRVLSPSVPARRTHPHRPPPQPRPPPSRQPTSPPRSARPSSMERSQP